MKKFAIVLLVLVLVAGCMAGCQDEKGAITQDEAIRIALEDAGVPSKEVTGLHVHTGTVGNEPVYEIHFYHGEEAYNYVISGVTGNVLTKGDEIRH